MNFNKQYLETYKNLIISTELQQGYQEFIKLFRYLKIELEKELPLFPFSGNIVENGMDYSYFQFTNKELKEKGLKIVVAFVHKDFCFEVWVSGYNRKIQCKYYEMLKNQTLKYSLNHNPNRVDYILKSPIDKLVDMNDGLSITKKLKANICVFIEYIKTII